MAPLLEIEDVIENTNLSVHQELNTIKSKAQLLEVLGSIWLNCEMLDFTFCRS